MHFKILTIYVIALTQAAPSIDSLSKDMKWREKIALECLDQVNIDPSIVRRAVATAIIPKDNAKYREFLTCSYKKQHYQSENGEILFDNIKEFLGRFYSRSDLKILDSCKNIHGADNGEIAVNTLECILINLGKIDEKFETNEISK